MTNSGDIGAVDLFAARSGDGFADLPPTLLPTVPASSIAMVWLRRTIDAIAASPGFPDETRRTARAVAAGQAPLRLLLDDPVFPPDTTVTAVAFDNDEPPTGKAHRWA